MIAAMGDSPDVVSPELALVDPALSLRERLRPAASREHGRARELRLRPAADPTASSVFAPARRSIVGRSPSASSGRRRIVLVAAAITGVSLLFVAGKATIEWASRGAAEVSGPAAPRVNVRPPRTTRPALVHQPHSKPTTSARADSSEQGASAATARRLAWAPSTGASSYHVELFRGQSRIFSTDTARPQVTIPASWTVGRKRQRLDAGEYRWYVWPVIAGVRSSSAVVQSRLSVPTN